MIPPSEIVQIAKMRENENLRFRTWLKCHADEEEFDARCKELHDELFSDYDCCQCGNCCRMYRTTIEEEDAERIAAYLGMTFDELKERYLIAGETGPVFPAPCPMLQEDGKCRIQEVKPEECKGFPYTDKPDRLYGLYGMMEYAGICPVVFEIVERLKELYRFRRRR